MSSRKSRPESDGFYRGRFAPSATGPLHLGSIFAALTSYLDAEHHQGDWLIRIDDLDSFRCKPKFTNEILKCLDAFHFEPSSSISFQSDRLALYEDAFQRLNDQGHLYTCTCSRKELHRGVCPGYCRKRVGQPLSPHTAIRINTDGMPLKFHDRFQGNTNENPCGDFIVRRRDGLFAYQLACAIDESVDHISHVVRGIDLMASTPMQVWIMGHLGLKIPFYAHHPVLIDQSGSKLSKQTFAPPIDPSKPGETYFKIAQLFRMTHSPSAAAPADIWLQYFQSEATIDTLLPKVTNLVV